MYFKIILIALFLFSFNQVYNNININHGLSHAGMKTKETQAGAVEIIAKPKSGTGPLIVHFKPKIINLKGPLRFRWLFGDGKDNSQRIPAPHYYYFGKFNVILQVTDTKGHLYSASLTIDSSPPAG